MHKRGNGIIKLYSSHNILLQLRSSVIILAGTPLNRIIVYSQVILQKYLSSTVCLNIRYFSKSKEIKMPQLKLNLVFDSYHMLLFMHLIYNALYNGRFISNITELDTGLCRRVI